MRKQRTPRSLSLLLLAATVTLALLFVGCESNSGDGGGGGTTTPAAGDVTLADGDSFRSVQVNISTTSTWFQVIDSVVQDAKLNATLTRISDQEPPEGTSFDIDWPEDENNVLTFQNETAGFSSVGRLNRLGNSHMVRDEVLTDEEGSLQVGVKAATDASNATLDGIYFVAMLHSDTSASPGFFSGYVYMAFNGSGTLSFPYPNPGNDQDFSDYTNGEPYTYSVASDGKLTIPSSMVFPRDLIGAVRADGELFVLAETRSDNSYKTIFVGIQQSEAATDALFEGVWDDSAICSDMSGSTPIDMWEGASVVTLDANGDGTYSDVGDPTSYPISIDVTDDGVFELPMGGGFSMMGAITPSGDTMVWVYPASHPEDNDYCMSVSVKTP